MTAVGLSSSGCADEPWLGVDELINDAQRWENERVRVRGFANISRSQTLASCSPQRCDCNETHSDFYLHGARSGLWIPEVKGNGDECQLTFEPFDPTARGFELVGRVEVVRLWGPTDHEVLDVRLVDLDLEASSQLVGRHTLETLDREPLRRGTVRCTCAEGGRLEACAELSCDLAPPR